MVFHLMINFFFIKYFIILHLDFNYYFFFNVFPNLKMAKTVCGSLRFINFILIILFIICSIDFPLKYFYLNFIFYFITVFPFLLPQSLRSGPGLILLYFSCQNFLFFAKFFFLYFCGAPFFI